MTEGAQSRACLALLVALTACTTRSPTADKPPPNTTPAIEVRAAHGELLLALLPRGAGAWAVRRPGAAQTSLRASEQGAELYKTAGLATFLEGGPSGMWLNDGRKKLRVSLGDPGRLTLLDAQGVPLLVVEGRVAHDGGGRLVEQLDGSGDRLLVLGREGERLGTVHNLTPGPWADAAALVLAATGIDADSRVTLAAYLLR